MKALELLNTAYRILQMDKGDEYRYNVAIPLKEAIAELEVPKTCEGCRYAKFPLEPICYKCERGKPDYYEPKDQK